jgi:hypothetical protein
MCHSLYNKNTQIPETISKSAKEQTLPTGNKPCITGVDGIKYEIAAVGANSAL